VELADGPTGCGEVARGGCLFAWNSSVARSTVLTEVERRAGPNMTLSLHYMSACIFWLYCSRFSKQSTYLSMLLSFIIFLSLLCMCMCAYLTRAEICKAFTVQK
jgi:hypothetical protein